ELNMSPGKISAQIGHVATLCTFYENQSSKFIQWLTNNQPKIILRGKEKELQKLIQNHNTYYIHDIGRTEIPTGSLTAIGFAPEWKSIMHPIIKRFQLL